MKIVLDIVALLICGGIGWFIYLMGRNVGYALIGGVATIVLVIASWLAIASFGVIPAGDVGVTLSWSRPTGELKQTGWYFAPAFLGYSVYPMQSTTIRQWPINNASAATQDLQQVTTDIVMNFHLTQIPESILSVYTTLRDNYGDVIGPITLEALKAVTAHYTAENLIDQRAQAKDELDALLRARLAKYGVQVDNVSLTQFRFSDEFNQAIEAKVTQQQSALQAQAKLAQVKWEAKQTITQANAEATALRLKRANITPTLVMQAFVDKWDGKLPTVMGGGSLMNLPQSLLGESSR